MAARSAYRSFASSARSAFHSSRNSFRRAHTEPSFSSSIPYRSPSKRIFRDQSSPISRRWAMTMIPLHNVVADAKLISHLAVSSRGCSSLSLGLQGFFGTHWSSLMKTVDCRLRP